MKKELMSFYNGVNRKGIDAIKWDGGVMRVGKADLIPLWVADSDYETCPEVKEALSERTKNGTFGYTYTNPNYYKIIANWFKTRHGFNINENHIIITPGVVNALYFLVHSFTKPQDKVVINTPVYNPFYEVVRNNGRVLLENKLVRVEIDDTLFTYKIDFDDLEEKLKEAKMYILCNPHNPVGRCFTYEELDRIVSLCKKYDVILVSDEIHCDLIMEGFKHCSIGNFFDKYENLVICTAPSKTFNVAGLSNSNIIVNSDELYRVFKKVYDDMEIELNVYGYEACKAAYTKGAYWVDLQNRYLTLQREIVYEFVKKHGFKVSKLEATYLMWIDMSKLGLKQEELFKGLIDNGVWVNKGTMYDSSCEGYIRINVACGRRQLLDGLKCIENFIDSLK